MCNKECMSKLNHPAALTAIGVLQLAVGLLAFVNAADNEWWRSDGVKIFWYIAGKYVAPNS